MTSPVPPATGTPSQEAAARFREAAAAKKCWTCGCLHSSVETVEKALAPGRRGPDLDAALREARARFQSVQYDCLGCAVCFPALALNSLAAADPSLPLDTDACAAAPAKERAGWPPFPGDFTVLRYRAPVAVCTLTNRDLAEEVVAWRPEGVSLVGTLQTENLGIERLVQNVVSNPHVRVLVVCGEDSLQAVGHLPGQSLLALAREGTDSISRILGARGRRPVLRNLPPAAVEHFRRTVRVLDRVGEGRLTEVLAAVAEAAEEAPGPGEPFDAARSVLPMRGRLPERMVPDPAGYFVVYPDRARGLLSVEHYRNEGTLAAVFEGATAAEVYPAIVLAEAVSRLDHAAYLGRELARAERSLATGEPFVQDAAPEAATGPDSHSSCGCGPGTCGSA